MTRRARLRQIAALAALLLLPVATTQAQRAATGWTFTWTMTPSGQGAVAPAITFDVAIWRGVARITPRTGQPAARALLGEASVILASSSDSLLTVLNTPKREALRATSDELAGLSGGAAGMQLTITEVTSRMSPGGAAPVFDGQPVKRLMLTQHYTMGVRVQQMQRTVDVSETTTLDLSPALDARDPGFRVFMQFVRALGKPGAVRSALKAKESELPRGVAVRSEAVTQTIAGSDTLRATVTSVMSALQRAPIDTATFRVPDGYRVTELRRLLQPRTRP